MTRPPLLFHNRWESTATNVDYDASVMTTNTIKECAWSVPFPPQWWVGIDRKPELDKHLVLNTYRKLS
jgi:hypothetical protein